MGAAVRSCNPRNVWGLASARCGDWVPYLPTWRAAVRFFIGFVRRTWPGARTPWDLHGYCPGCPWPETVARWMHSWGFAAQVRYR